MRAFNDLQEHDDGWKFLRKVEVWLNRSGEMLTLAFPTKADYDFANSRIASLNERLGWHCVGLGIKHLRLCKKGPTLQPVEIPADQEVAKRDRT